MEIIIELSLWVLVEFLWYFIMYNTGAIVLRVISFGKIKHPLWFFGATKNINKFHVSILVGLLSYVVIIFAFAIANWF
jgi:hypothetical protein